MIKKAIFDKKNVVVFGGAGFIGSQLCDELIKESKVICIDNFISSNQENINHLLTNPNFEFIKADINKPVDLEAYPELDQFQITFQGIQEVYNLACPTSRKNFEENIIDTYLANSLGVYQTLEMAKKYKAKYLFMSSSAVYGNSLKGQTSFSEDYWGFTDFLSPRACYNEGKRFAEAMVHDYGKQFKVDVKIARIFNTYGPRMKLNSGRMIPDFVKAALEDENLVIYGDGQEESSYCYVLDIIQGLLKLMTSNINDPINIGSSETYKIVDLAKIIIKHTESKSKISFEQSLESLIQPGIPDTTKAKEQLGWFPLIKIENGLEKTIEDMKANRHLHYRSNNQAINNQ